MWKPWRKSNSCLFVQATLPTCRYALVQESAHDPQLVCVGSFELEDLSELAEKARHEVRSYGAVTRAVLLLPRGEVEVNALSLPPADEAELPGLVGNLVAQTSEELADAVHDFVISKVMDDASRDVLAFTVRAEVLNEWTLQFKAHGFALETITFGGLGAVCLLNEVTQNPAKMSVVVTTTDQDTDLAVVENNRPQLFRTMPHATGADPLAIELLADDISRTLTLQGHPDDEDPHVYLIGTNDAEQKTAAKLLNDRLRLPVSLVNPFDQLSGDLTTAANVSKPSRYANLIGLACAWNRHQLEANLLAPKRPPQPPSLWSRYGFWSSVAACLLAVAGYLVWEQGDRQSAELAEQNAQLQRLIKPVKKAQTKQAIAQALAGWQASQVNWLDELYYLSEKLPSAEQATIAKVTMTIEPGQPGRIDLPVEITDAALRATVEENVADDRHGISSKRLVDASNAVQEAWRFQATVSVAPGPRRAGDAQ